MTSNSKKFWKKVNELPPKSRRLFFFLALVGVIAVFATIYMHFAKKTSIKFPESNLQRYGAIQKYVHGTYSTLPTEIVFPNTNYAIDLAGDVIRYSDTSIATRYDDQTILVAGVYYTSIPFAQEVPYMICGALYGTTPSEDVYKSYVSDKGFLNTREAEYEGGIISGDGMETLYVLCYQSPIDNGMSVFMSVVTNDYSRLSKNKDLLNRIFTTLYQKDYVGSYSFGGKYGEGASISNDLQEETGETELAGTEETDASGSTDTETAQKTNERTVREILDDRQRENDDLSIKADIYADEYLVMTVDCPASLTNEKSIFDFDYSNYVETPRTVELVSPSGRVYEPFCMNALQNGIVQYRVFSPEPGEWTLTVPTQKYGTYRFYVSKYDPVPHNAEAGMEISTLEADEWLNKRKY